MEITITLNFEADPKEVEFEYFNQRKDHENPPNINGEQWLALDPVDRDDWLLVQEAKLLSKHTPNIMSSYVDIED
jgi:hypothetical protein